MGMPDSHSSACTSAISSVGSSTLNIALCSGFDLRQNAVVASATNELAGMVSLVNGHDGLVGVHFLVCLARVV